VADCHPPRSGDSLLEGVGTPMDITREIKGLALSRGADLVGVASCADLPENAESFSWLLPGARRVVVVAYLISGTDWTKGPRSSTVS